MVFYRNFCILTSLMATACALQAQDVPKILSNVKIYGTLIAFADSIEATGASTRASDSNALVTVSPTATNVPNRGRITTGTSNIGFKGDVDTPVKGLKVFWQVESSVSVDGDQPSTLAGRNSALGLTSDAWGRVFIGSWDTPYKYPTLFMGAARGLLPFDGYLYGNPGFNVPGTVTNSGRATSKNDASFNRRQGNSIQYWTPDLAGFSAKLAYSVNEGRTNNNTDAATAPQVNPTLFSALVSYQYQTLVLSAGYESHTDYFGLSQMTANSSAAGTASNPSSKDEGMELVAFYVLPASKTRFTGLVEQLKYHDDEKAANFVREYKRTAWTVSVQQPFGDHKVWATFGTAGDGSAKVVGTGSTSTEGLGAKQFSLGYSYSLGKSVDLMAAYYTMRNDAAATYGLFPLLSGLNPGADTQGFGVGMLYTF
ncbi:MAG: porin [Holophaga sp.]|nr:porin [Holophaga sp.]